MEPVLISQISDNPVDSKENLFDGIFKEYERVIMESIITSFGLDFLVKDQHGGDVDTINNVRKVGVDPDMVYKNKKNEKAFAQRGDYDRNSYHQNNKAYHSIVQDAKKSFNEKGQWQEDAYVPGNKVAYNSALPSENRAQLDHVLSAKGIHDDPGRVLAELNGEELANRESNLVFTNMYLNNNMKDKTVDEYIDWCEKNPDKVNYNGKKGEPLPDDVKDNLRKEYDKAKKQYEAELARKYYTSKKFVADTAKAAGKQGAMMGIRQALGFVFVEVWLSAKEAIKNIPSGADIQLMIKRVGEGIKIGFENAVKKYKDIIEKANEGFVAGALSSITTTLCNVFFTTAKSIVKIIRQTYASVVQAGKILLFNPDDLPFGERVKAAMVILATGASVLVGTLVGEAINESPIGKIPVVGSIVVAFCSSLVTGLLSCTLLAFLDRSEFINRLIRVMNRFSFDISSFSEIGDAMDNLAAQLESIDVEKFKENTDKYNRVVSDIEKCNNEEQLYGVLVNLYEELDIQIPWIGEFDEFMRDKNNRLAYE